MQTINNSSNQVQYRIRINKYIRVPQVRVILADGSNGGIMDTPEALKLAQGQNLDLIEINPKASPPVCRIAEYGKLKYEEKKKKQAEKKAHHVQEMKELTIRPNIADNDLNHKIEQAKQFLTEGHRVKITLRFRGREITLPQVGRDKINSIILHLGETILPNPFISLEGKFMNVILAPNKK